MAVRKEYMSAVYLVETTVVEKAVSMVKRRAEL